MKNQTYPFQLMALPYPYDALEPYIDKETMHYHHDKHHQAYVDNLNKAIAPYPEFHSYTLPQLLTSLSKLPEEIKNAVRNNGGGVYNHNLFWEIMTPNAPSKPVGKLGEAINRDFNSFDELKVAFKKAALGRFGSGWAWLVSDNNGKLSVVSTANQDIPDIDNYQLVLPLDVWEHAYYLKYQNRRGDYIDNWFNVINWEYANKLYTQ